MSERQDEHFELDEEFLAENDSEDTEYDRILGTDRRKPKPGTRGKAAWSKLEDVLAERRLKKALQDFEDEA